MGDVEIRRRPLLAFIAAAMLLLMASCASGSSDAAASEPSAAPTQSAAAEPSVDEPAATAPETSDQPTANEVYVSPIGEALGIAQDEQFAAFDTYVNNAEELIRECMIDAGFDYAPTTSGIARSVQAQFALESSLTAEQFREQYGFGIATLFELNFEGDGVLDFVNQQFGPPPTEQRSPAEQDAYEIALNGESTQGLNAEEAQDQLFGGNVGASLDGSCRSYGYSTAENPGAAFDGLFSILGDELDALTDKYDSDPRIREATAEWQTCMASRGHSYEEQVDIRQELQDRSDELANQFFSSSQVLTALGEAQQQGFAAMDGDARQVFLEEAGALQGFSWVPEVQAEYDELVAFELQVAADSFDCSDEDLLFEVQLELETEFVETHADQLALIAAGDA